MDNSISSGLITSFKKALFINALLLKKSLPSCRGLRLAAKNQWRVVTIAPQQGEGYTSSIDGLYR